MNKNTIIGFVLIGVILFGFSWYQSRPFKKPAAYQAQLESIARVEMLAQIAERYCCICPPELSGSMDELMVNSISEFQRINALPVSGKLDKATWKNLIMQFALSEMIANRRRNRQA